MKIKKILILLIFTLVAFPSGFSSETGTKNNGYKIKIEIKDPTFDKLFILGYYGGESFKIDSCTSSNGKFVFNKKEGIPEGIYSVVSDKQNYCFDIIISQSRRLEIVTQQMNPLKYQKITKNNENIVFFEYQKALLQQEEITPFIETSPGTFLSNYIRAKHISDFNNHFDDILSSFDTLSMDNMNQMILDHHFDQIDLQDPRLLRTPMKIDMEYYFVTLFESMAQDENDYVKYLDLFLSRTIDTNINPIHLESQFYYVKKIMQLYLYNNPKFDPLFVYLFDQYYHPELDQWHVFSDSDQRIFSNIAERKRRTLPEHQIEPIEGYNEKHQKISSDQLNHEFIVLWFWDPDCEHCLHETPILYHFYLNNKTKYNFEVMAISVTEDFERWDKFIRSNHLDWINISYAMGEPNYDFIDYFDLLVTPGIFIIDKNHIIKARQFSLTRLEEIFENLK